MNKNTDMSERITLKRCEPSKISKGSTQTMTRSQISRFFQRQKADKSKTAQQTIEVNQEVPMLPDPYANPDTLSDRSKNGRRSTRNNRIS